MGYIDYDDFDDDVLKDMIEYIEVGTLSPFNRKKAIASFKKWEDGIWERWDELFGKYVPEEGSPRDRVGRLVTAVNYSVYRLLNDGVSFRDTMSGRTGRKEDLHRDDAKFLKRYMSIVSSDDSTDSLAAVEMLRDVIRRIVKISPGEREEPYGQMTVRELKRLATEKKIAGRSKMNKKGLVEALVAGYKLERS